MPNEYTLKAGTLAFYDGFLCGLVPVKVLNIYSQLGPLDRPELVADLKVTAARRAFARGEVLLAITVRLDKVLHRRQVYVRGGQYRIRGRTEFLVSQGMPRNTDGSLDQSYTVEGERHTADYTCWTARYLGEWIGHSASLAGAQMVAREHAEGRIAFRH